MLVFPLLLFGFCLVFEWVCCFIFKNRRGAHGDFPLKTHQNHVFLTVIYAYRVAFVWGFCLVLGGVVALFLKTEGVHMVIFH